ncbi:MAG: hypothetical protein H6812_00300 [Phycisphaeraceae bacterium]|nr:hypothetical protein [Phycisphaerales bacterium]MCB9841678.1 hypothetical protein [Phycisphaeraceae bacterium]
MNERDLAILKHIGLYRISLRPILARLFFDGNEPALANVLKRLKADGRLQTCTGLPGNMSYYQLTKLGARDVGVPEARAGALGNQAFGQHLAILWFCCGTTKRRFRVPAEELPPVPAGEYCVTMEDGRRLLRVYAPSDTAERASIHRAIAEHVEVLSSDPVAGQHVRNRGIGIAILVHSIEQRDELKATMRSSDRALGGLRKMFSVIEVVPSIATLSRMIHELRSHNSQS